MASRFAFALIVILGLFQLSSSKAAGYLYSADSSATRQLMKDVPEELVFNDVDLKHLIAHNLGVLHSEQDIIPSAKDLISKFGSKALLQHQKLNYLFLLESDNSGIQKGYLEQLDIKHKNAFFSLCSEDTTEKCILDLLYDSSQEESLVNILKKQAKKQHIEAFFYSSEPNTANSYFENALSLFQDAKSGAMMLIDNGKSDIFRLKTNISQCVNSVLAKNYAVDVTARTIQSLKSDDKIVFDESHKEAFLQFMTDLCSVNTISKMVQKDAEPSFFTFYIDSLAKLENIVDTEKSKMLYNIWTITYNSFLANIKRKYDTQEVSGQVFVLGSEEGLGKKYKNDVRNKVQNSVEDILAHKNMIQTNSHTRNLASPATPTTETGVVFQSVLFFFVLICIYVCIEMFEMENQKDSVVYAKFVANDYLRK